MKIDEDIVKNIPVSSKGGFFSLAIFTRVIFPLAIITTVLMLFILITELDRVKSIFYSMLKIPMIESDESVPIETQLNIKIDNIKIYLPSTYYKFSKNLLYRVKGSAHCVANANPQENDNKSIYSVTNTQHPYYKFIKNNISEYLELVHATNDKLTVNESNTISKIIIATLQRDGNLYGCVMKNFNVTARIR